MLGVFDVLGQPDWSRSALIDKISTFPCPGNVLFGYVFLKLVRCLMFLKVFGDGDQVGCYCAGSSANMTADAAVGIVYVSPIAQM